MITMRAPALSHCCTRSKMMSAEARLDSIRSEPQRQFVESACGIDSERGRFVRNNCQFGRMSQQLLHENAHLQLRQGCAGADVNASAPEEIFARIAIQT